MNISRRQWILTGASVAVLPHAWAADAAWPSKPLRLIAGGVGSVADIRARWLAERLVPALGQPVIVENNGSAGGNVGAEQVARSAPDGYTLLMIHQGTAAINPHLYARTGYDALGDFAPITRFGHGPLLMTVHAGFQATSVAELVALAKAKPTALTYGSPGIGTPPHLASELFKRAAAIEATHVPFKGGGALATALLGGHVTWSMDGPTVQVQHVKSGRLRALAVTGARRSPALPDVPTLAEAGVPGCEYHGWTGIAAPSATPKAVVARLHAEITRIMATPDAQDWFAASGAEPGALSPDAFAELIRTEHAAFGKVIRDAGIRVE